MPESAFAGAPEDALAEVAAELDACDASGCTVGWWWRDDDARTDTPQLQRLLRLSGRFGLPVMLSVIPMRCDMLLRKALRAAPLASVAQHGFAHRNHEPVYAAEFGMARPLGEVRAEIAEGADCLYWLFGADALPVFVPPWNVLRGDAWPLLPELGIRGLSALGRRGSSEAAPQLTLANIHIDIIDWDSQWNGLASPILLARRIASALRDRREGSWPADEPIGLLTHHLVMDDWAWGFVEDLFSLLAPRRRCYAAEDVFGLRPQAPVEAIPRGCAAPVPALPGREASGRSGW